MLIDFDFDIRRKTKMAYFENYSLFDDGILFYRNYFNIV